MNSLCYGVNNCEAGSALLRVGRFGRNEAHLVWLLNRCSCSQGRPGAIVEQHSTDESSVSDEEEEYGVHG